jgi:hypothetical protein
MSKNSRSTASLSAITVTRRAVPPPESVPVAAAEKNGDITEDLAIAVPPAIAPEPPPPPPLRQPATPHAAPPQQSATLPTELPARAEEIVVYWERLRRGRPFPALSEVDRSLVGNAWPDSLIVAFEGGDMAMPRISRLGATDGDIEYTPMVTDWILTRARHAARRAIKLDEVQSFPMENDTPHYRLLLMPLGAGNGASDCVLCHLCRAA